jgi:peptidyl-prolyl cis-trans isomerase A (cyclophilin A)
VTRKNRRDRKNDYERAAQAPAPSSGQASGTPAASTRPGAVFAIVAILIIVVVGGGFLVFYYTQRGPSGPNPQVVMETSAGTIKIELFQQQAPISVKNFLAYVDNKFYDGTIFHRVMPDFMIQGGGFLPGMVQKRPLFDPIRNEAGNGLSNERGTIAMARTDNPDSATDQFYINLVDNRQGLDPRPPSAGYAVFGRVIEGMGVVDKIASVSTAAQAGHQNVPEQDVLIKSVRRVETK